MLLEMLSKAAKMPEDQLIRIARTADVRYKVYKIPKRSGGERTIEHPSRQLKAFQRWIAKVVFAPMPLHDCATAYRRGSGIRSNAERHAHTNYTNRYDFSDFFPSFSGERIAQFLREASARGTIKLDEADIEFVCLMVCRHGRLTIGAPNSPIITNVMMYSFDLVLGNFCERRGLIYSRYADDIFVSSFEPSNLLQVGAFIEQAIAGVSYLDLRLKSAKTAYLSRRYSRRITGLTVTTDRRISLGRERKREIRSLVYQCLLGNLEAEQVLRLRGLIAFAIDVEPDFRLRLESKYGGSAIEAILKGEFVLPPSK